MNDRNRQRKLCTEDRRKVIRVLIRLAELSTSERDREYYIDRVAHIALQIATVKKRGRPKCSS